MVRRLLAGSLLLSACGGTFSVAPVVPAYEPENQAKCQVHASQDRPLVIEWPSNDRVALESRLLRGVVAVRYEGCEMQVLRCGAEVPYRYQGVTYASEQVTIEDVDTLYANLPLGAIELEGKLEETGRLDVAMTVAGRYEATESQIERRQLEGDQCDLATHVVAAVNVGAFSLTAGGRTSQEGRIGVMGSDGGRRRNALRSELKRGGDVAQCAVASRDDTTPPEGCGALLRLEVVPVGEPRLASPTCPRGWRWTGSQCVRDQPLAEVAPSPDPAPSPSPITMPDDDDGLDAGTTTLIVLGALAGNALWIVPVVLNAQENAEPNVQAASPTRDGNIDEAPLGGLKVEF